MGPGRGIRQSMSWLHSWAGVILGGLLLVVFWTGTLSLFDREIDRWMQPATRLGPPPAEVSLDRLLLEHAQQLAGASPMWTISLPSARAPTLQLDYQDPAQGAVRRHIDPRSGALLADEGSWAGTGFIFPFHYSLHLNWRDIGYWLVGVAGMGMLTLLVSGVIAHRKLIAEFFTFRPRKRLQRSLLDLHNLTGVMVLPFHFIISLSGLVIFCLIYFPGIARDLYPDDPARLQLEAFGAYARPASGVAAPLASLDAMRGGAERIWADAGRPARAYLLRVWHPGDRNAYVEIRRSFAADVTMNVDRLTFDGATGELLHQHWTPPVVGIQRFLTGLHFIQFDHWTLRWLYFAGGLAGCLLIGSGLLFWSGSRHARHARQGKQGARLVGAVAVASTIGLVIATLTFFVANRLLPVDIAAPGQRAALEAWVFFAAWLMTLAQACWRPATAWQQQLQFAAAMAMLAVLLNWLTTGAHLLHSLSSGSAAVAGMDLMLLAFAGMCLLGARRIARAQLAMPATHARGAPQDA
jgi:uncharacterized iron-regulated membrane protein